MGATCNAILDWLKQAPHALDLASECAGYPWGQPHTIHWAHGPDEFDTPALDVSCSYALPEASNPATVRTGLNGLLV